MYFPFNWDSFFLNDQYCKMKVIENDTYPVSTSFESLFACFIATSMENKSERKLFSLAWLRLSIRLRSGHSNHGDHFPLSMKLLI